MSKLVLGGERGTYPFNNGGMVSLVPYDKIIPVGDAPQHSLVDGEAGWKDDRLVLIHEIGKFTLQLQVDVERTVQKTRARHPGPVLFSSGNRGFLHLRVVCQPQVGI